MKAIDMIPKIKELLEKATPDLCSFIDPTIQTKEEWLEWCSLVWDETQESGNADPKGLYWVGTSTNLVVAITGNGPTSEINANFIVAARDFIPLAIAELEK